MGSFLDVGRNTRERGQHGAGLRDKHYAVGPRCRPSKTVCMTAAQRAVTSEQQRGIH